MIPDPKPGKKPKKKRKQDKKYQEFIRSQPCICCNRTPSEHHHESLTGGSMGGKCNDRQSLPLCSEHHRWGRFSRENMGKVSFYEYWGIDYVSEIYKYQKLYDKGGAM